MKYKLLLLFSVTFALFFLLLVPIIYPFKSEDFSNAVISCGYFAWYVMIFILIICWGNIVKNKGCWFFSNN